MTGYSVNAIYEEAAFIAYYFHWQHDDIMNMEHAERKRWCAEISKINRKVGGKKENPFDI